MAVVLSDSDVVVCVFERASRSFIDPFGFEVRLILGDVKGVQRISAVYDLHVGQRRGAVNLYRKLSLFARFEGYLAPERMAVERRVSDDSGSAGCVAAAVVESLKNRGRIEAVRRVWS